MGALRAWLGLLLSVAASAGEAPAGDLTQMSTALFRDVQSFWSQQVASLGGRYRPTQLHFFGEPLSHPCGLKTVVRGPFYCPGDETVYLDQGFLQQLGQSSRQDANVAVGFVVAHEMAHHIQNVIGTTALVEQARARSTPELATRILTTLELQADCYAGLWARWSAAQGTIKVPDDISGLLDTVAAVSQQWQSHLTGGQQMLDPFTQGSAAQRLKWFRRGLDSGNFNDCDTFGAASAGSL
jgi:predicted metalloprotease